MGNVIELGKLYPIKGHYIHYNVCVVKDLFEKRLYNLEKKKHFGQAYLVTKVCAILHRGNDHKKWLGGQR